MALTAERYTEVKAELAQMETRLFALALEIDGAAPVTEKQGFVYQAAWRAGGAVSHLRYVLKAQQDQTRLGDEIQRRLYGVAKT